MSDLVHIAAAPHPFHSNRDVDIEVPEGLTILEMLKMAQPDSILQKHAHIFVNDVIIPKEYWHLVRPKAGNTVSIGVTAGNRNFLRIVLTLGVVFAAFAFGPALGQTLVGSTSFTLFGQTVSSAALGGAIIQVGGALLVNALVPIRPDSVKQNPAESPSYFLDRAQNNAAIYNPVPVIFGRHKVVPPLGAVPITEVVGDRNHLRMIVIWGYGPLRISNIKIGETPITDFADVRIETREGRPGDAPISIYPDDIYQENLNITLENPDAGNPGAWSTRRSQVDADELSIDITMPRGLAAFNRKGKRVSHSVVFEIQYKQVGTPTWLSVIPALTATTMDTTKFDMPTNGQITLEASRTQPIRHGIRWGPPVRGQYDVRLRRISGDETEDTKNSTIIWSALRTITDRAPVNFPVPLAMTAIDIRASEQLSSVINNLNGIVESEVHDYNGVSWVRDYGRNPASMMRLALQGPARRKPAEDSEIDIETLEQFYTFCEDNEYKFDHIHDSRRGLWDILSDICAVARARPINLDGKWSVVYDSGNQMVRQHFSPLNSSNFEMSRSYAEPSHGLRVTFANEEADWNRDERIVYNDGYTDANASLLPTLNLIGITNKDHIYKFARFHLAQILLRREVWTFNTGFEHLIIRRPGHRVSLQHEVLVVGLSSARVVGRTLNDQGHIEGIQIDAPIQFPYEASWGIKIRTKSNQHIIARLTNTGEIRSTPIDNLVFTEAIEEDIEIGALVSIGEAGYETIDGLVTNIESEEEMSASLTLVPFQEGIYQAETGLIPPFQSGIARSPIHLQLIVIRVISDRSVLRLIGFVYEPGIRVEVRPIANQFAEIEIEIRGNNTGEPWRPAEVRYKARDSVEIGGVETGATYDLRLRWSFRGESTPGSWTEVIGHRVVGTSPPAPTDFAISEVIGNMRQFSWTSPDIPDFAGVRIRYSTADNTPWEDMAPIVEGLLPGNPYISVQPSGSGRYHFGIVSVNTDAEESAVVRLTANLGDVEEGLDGEEGVGVEYIYVSSLNGAIITGSANLPDPNWDYDIPALVNGLRRGNQTYYDGNPQDLSHGRPFRIRFRRSVPGSPNIGEDIGNRPWTQDSAVRIYGADGEEGVDGEDGSTYEYIFCSSETGRAISGSSNLPLSTWRYDRSELRFGYRRGSVTYYDGNPRDLNEGRPFRIRFRRSVRISGTPVQNAALEYSSEWIQEPAIRVHGATGEEGVDGEEGVGVEYCFTSSVTGSRITSSSNLPLNSWSYDSFPSIGRRRGFGSSLGSTYFIYYDGEPPRLSDTMPYRIRFRRSVPGSPSVGGSSARFGPWIQEAAIKVVGADGEEGLDGEEGVGEEYCFTLKRTIGPIYISAYLPLNSWTYDSFPSTGRRRGSGSSLGSTYFQYYDGEPPGLSNDIPYRIRFRRKVPGSPSIGASSARFGPWIQDAAVRAHGQKGDLAELNTGDVRTYHIALSATASIYHAEWDGETAVQLGNRTVKTIGGNLSVSGGTGYEALVTCSIRAYSADQNGRATLAVLANGVLVDDTDMSWVNNTHDNQTLVVVGKVDLATAKTFTVRAQTHDDSEIVVSEWHMTVYVAKR